MAGLKHFQFAEDVMEDKLKRFEWLELRTYFNGFFYSFEKDNLLMFLNSLWVELFDVLEFAVEGPDPFEWGVVENVWGDEQLSE